MITERTIYWVTRCDPVRNLLIGYTVLSIFVTLFLGICIFEKNWFINKKIIMYGMIVSFCTFLFSSISLVFIPTTKEMCTIKLIPAVVNNHEIQQSAKNSLKLLEIETEKWLNDKIEKETE